MEKKKTLGPPSPSYCMFLWLRGYMSSPTPGIWCHWPHAPTDVLALLRVTGERGEATVTSKAAGFPLSHP